MQELNFNALFQVTGAYQADYTFYVHSYNYFEVVQSYVHQLENNEITIDEFFEFTTPYLRYFNDPYRLIEIHIS